VNAPPAIRSIGIDAPGPVRNGLVTDIASLTRMRPFLVLAAHPDDETLGCGGLLARTARLGIEGHVVVLTDGARSHAAPGWPAGRLAAVRALEVRAAMAALGVPAARLHLLAQPDGELAETDDLTNAVAKIAATGGAETVFVTDPADSHPDHRAAFRLAVRLVACGAVRGLVTFPVSQCFEGGDLARFELLTVATELSVKRAALSAHRSQTGSLLPPGTGFHLTTGALKPFLDGVERFRPVHAMPGALPADEPGHFDRLFAANPDPWNYGCSSYEQGRHAETVSALGDRRFRRAWEAGTAGGALAERLLPLCEMLVATDASPRATAIARERLGDRADVRCMRLPQDAPEGLFDLILLSDMLYYLGLDGVIEAAALCRDRLLPGGLLIVVSWLGETEAALTGEESAEALLACIGPGFTILQQARHTGFRLDLLQKCTA